jgi:hypothetical protein
VPTRLERSAPLLPACVGSEHGVHDTAHDHVVPCTGDAFPRLAGSWSLSGRRGLPEHGASRCVFRQPANRSIVRGRCHRNQHRHGDSRCSVVISRRIAGILQFGNTKYPDGSDRRVAGCTVPSLDLSRSKRWGRGKTCSSGRSHQALLTCKPAATSDGRFISHSNDVYLLVKRQKAQPPAPAPRARHDAKRVLLRASCQRNRVLRGSATSRPSRHGQRSRTKSRAGRRWLGGMHLEGLDRRVWNRQRLEPRHQSDRERGSGNRLRRAPRGGAPPGAPPSLMRPWCPASCARLRSPCGRTVRRAPHPAGLASGHAASACSPAGDPAAPQSGQPAHQADWR